MKFKKVVCFVSALSILSSLLAGCGGSIKTGRIASKFGSALKNQPITSATAELTAGVSAQGEDTEWDAKLRSVVHSKTDWEVNRSYSEVNTTISLDDRSISQELDCYTSGESGEDVRYVHIDPSDTWLRLANQKRAVDIDPGLILLLLDKVAEDTTLESRDDRVGGNVHHILGLIFSAQDIWDFAESAGLNIPAEFAQCDLKGVTIPVELEIEDKTFLPIRLQVKVQGINNSLIQAIAASLAKGKAVENLTLQMDEIRLLITNFGYGPQDIPMLPKGAAENALDMEKVKEIQN